MEYVPHEYQKYATNHIIEHKESALFLSCGLGKTIITLQAINELCLDSFEVRKVLIVAPLRVARDTWPEEIEKWDCLEGLTYSVCIGDAKQRMAALKTPASIYIINRENLDWLICESGLPFNFDMVVLDELSSFKSHQTKRFKAFREVRPKVKRIVGLSATPSPNSLLDLWSEFMLLDRGKRLGPYIGKFRSEYFVPDKRNGMQIWSWKPVIGSQERIFNAISDMTISMRSEDYLDMPELILNEVPVHLDEFDKKVYSNFKKELAAEIQGKEITAMNAASLSNKLLQMANGAVYTDDGKVLGIHDKKLEALEDLIEAANGNPVMIAYWYKHDMERIQRRFKIREIKTSKDIQDWNSGKIDIACIHPASAGHGLNLQKGGSTLIWFGLTWSLELYQQTNARLYRQGQDHSVVIHHLITKGTIDEQVMAALKRKDQSQSALIDAVKAEIGKE